MHYIGGGTEFPFPILEKSVRECGSAQPIRVVITDTDFDHNYAGSSRHARIFADAVRASPHFVLMLHCPDEGRAAHYRKVGAKVVPILDREDFPKMAAALSLALFEEDRHVAR
jgi:hypothetical protein